MCQTYLEIEFSRQYFMNTLPVRYHDNIVLHRAEDSPLYPQVVSDHGTVMMGTRNGSWYTLTLLFYNEQVSTMIRHIIAMAWLLLKSERYCGIGS